MDLTFSEQETAFRDELRAWLAANEPGEAPHGDEDAHYAWRRDWQRRHTNRSSASSLPAPKQRAR